LEISDETINRSKKIFIKALVGGNEMTREELMLVLDKNGIPPSGQRGIHILGRLAMEGLLCFGSRKGKQQTFTILDEWIPETKPKDPDESIAELTKRYFTSHGPATVKDFAWWSGLTIKEVNQGLTEIKDMLFHETINGQTYWFAIKQKPKKLQEKVLLLPSYDEYTVAYKDRSAIIASNNFIQAGNGLRPTIVFNGQIIGTWTRELKKHTVRMKPHFFDEITKLVSIALHTAAQTYSTFLGRDLKLL